MTGTLFNTAAIIIGSILGMLIHSRLPQKIVGIVFQGIGLFTIALGVSMSLRSGNMLILVVSLVIGGSVGQWIDIDKYLRRFSDYLQRKTMKKENTSGSGRFTEGFITASMLFCVGSMSILGAIEDGLGQTPNLLYTKSIMDGISSIALASSFGIAVLFSSIPVLLYQGGLTLLAVYVMRFMSDVMIADLTAVGGIILIGLGITILKIKELNVVNLLPALVVVVILSYFWG